MQRMCKQGGRIMDKLLMLFLLSLPIYIIGAWTLAGWLADYTNYYYRLYKENKLRRQYDIPNN